MATPKRRLVAALLTATIIAATPACSAEFGKAQRLPDQQHNRMVYVKTRGQNDVYVDMPGHYDVGSPSISPDGKMVAFDALTVGLNPARESWLAGTDGTGLRKLTDGAAPRWSPDGRRILFTRNAPSDMAGTIGSDVSLFEIDLTTRKERQLFAGRFGDWSPDGRRIAYSKRGPRTEMGGTHTGSKVAIADPDGSNVQELGDGDWPSWSPDGKMIACCIHEEPNLPVLCVIDLATKKRRVLGAGHYRAQWAGDGKSVVANGYMIDPDREHLPRCLARFWIDDNRIDYFLLDLDTPWSPCLSADDKTTAVIVDSRERRPLFNLPSGDRE